MKPDYSQRTILVLKGGSEFVIFKYFEYCNEHIQNLQFKSRAQDNDPLFVHRILLVLELYGPIETRLIRWTFMGEKPCLKNLKILKMLFKVLRCHFWLKAGNIVPGKGALAKIPCPRHSLAEQAPAIITVEITALTLGLSCRPTAYQLKLENVG